MKFLNSQSFGSRRNARSAKRRTRVGRAQLRTQHLEERAVMAADAFNDTGSTNENTILTTVSPGVASLLANDTGSPLSVVGAQSTSANGATVVVNSDGTFSYNPTTSATLQALSTGQSIVDTFNYKIAEGSTTLTPGLSVSVYRGANSAIASADAERAGGPADQTGTVNLASFEGGPHFGFQNGVPGGAGDGYAVFMDGTLRVLTAGTYTFGTNSDDNSRIRIDRNLDGVLATDGSETVAFQGGCCNDQFGTPVFLNAGDYKFEAVYTEGGGGDYGEFFYAPGAKSGFDGSFRLIGDSSQGIAAGQVSYSSDTATVSITVSGVNSAPVATANAYTTGENNILTIGAPTSTPGINVLVFDGTNDQIASADAAKNSRPADSTSITTFADFLDNGGSDHFDVNNAVPAPGGGDSYAVFMTGFLKVNVGGTYTFGTHSDDNSRIRVDLNRDGVLATDGSEDVVLQGSCCADKFGTPVNLNAGVYAFEAVYTEGGGGDYGEFFYAPGSHGSFNSSFRLIGDSSQGIETLATYNDGRLTTNDSDEEIPNGTPAQNLTVVGFNGTASMSGTTANGATVTLNADGTFTYNPNTSAAAQALSAGQTLVDTFTYTVSDNAAGGAATSTGTVTITVVGVADPAPDAYSIGEDVGLGVSGPGVLGNDQVPAYRIGPNVALTGVASQSTTAFGGDASRAIDGNTDGNYGANSTTHTDSQPQEWWQVQLSSTTAISQIKVYNRSDCCGDRLSNFRVSVWNGVPNAPGSTEVWGQNYFANGQVAQGGSLTIGPNDLSSLGNVLGGSSGNYVRVQLLGQNNLSLAEVQVFSALPPLFEVGQAQGTPVPGSVNTPNDGNVTVPVTGGGSVQVFDNGSFLYNQGGAFNGLDTGETATASFNYNVALPTGSAQINFESSNGTFNVSNKDLINGMTPTRTGTVLSGYEGTSSNPLTVTNGTFGPQNHNDPSQELTIGDNAGVGPGTTFTYALDLGASPTGYALTGVDVYSAWSDNGRDNQRYTVQYSTVANPGVYTTIATVGDFAPPAGPNGKSSITSSSGILATNVANVRFFFPDPQENNYAGYRELDVFGFAMPTPTTVTITIHGGNDAPTGSVAPATVAEGEDLSLSATGNDVDGEALTFSWDLNNDGIFGDATGQTPTITWDQLQALSPPVNDNGVKNAKVRISDGTANTDVSFTYTVTNSPPTAIVTGPSVVALGQSTNFTFSADDPSDADNAGAFDYVINWGDGSADEVYTDVVGDLVASHAYSTLDTFTITVTATDKDGGTSDPTEFEVESSPVIVDDAGNLVVGGFDDKDDTIAFATGPNGRVKVTVTSGGVMTNYGPYQLGSEAKLIANGLGGNDSITNTSNYPVSFDGGAGNDYLAGGALNDTLIGGLGNDRILGGNGNDYIDAGADADSVDAGAGNDTIFGGAGVDTLNGSAGNDLIDGGADNDTMNGGADDDVMFGGDGNDNVNGSSGNDVIIGGADNDTLLGDTGRDILLGGNGKDTLNGGNDDDVLAGGLTTYDNYTAANYAAVQLLMAEWTSGNPYATRVANLKSGNVTTGGNQLNPTVNVTNDDGFNDTFTGGAGITTGGVDWFLASTATSGIHKDTINDRTSPTELLN